MPTGLNAPLAPCLRARTSTSPLASGAAGPIEPVRETPPVEAVAFLMLIVPFTVTGTAVVADGDSVSPYAGFSAAFSIWEIDPVAAWYEPDDGGVNVMR